MPKHRYERREPSHKRQDIQPLLKDPAQIHYEILPFLLPGFRSRPVGDLRPFTPRLNAGFVGKDHAVGKE